MKAVLISLMICLGLSTIASADCAGGTCGVRSSTKKYGRTYGAPKSKQYNKRSYGYSKVRTSRHYGESMGHATPKHKYGKTASTQNPINQKKQMVIEAKKMAIE